MLDFQKVLSFSHITTYNIRFLFFVLYAIAEKQEKIYKERNKRVANVCRKYGLERPNGELNMTVLKRFYIWNGEYNMGYCLQSKTGTTTWMMNWLRVSHLPKVRSLRERRF